MKIQSINPYYVTSGTNHVSMNGTTSDKKNVIAKVNKFLEDNKLPLTGTVMFDSKGTQYSAVILGYKDNPYFIRTKDGLDNILISDCTSSDEILYKLAQKISGKTIYNPVEANNCCAMFLIGGYTEGYKPEITVPDFFNK